MARSSEGRRRPSRSRRAAAVGVGFGIAVALGIEAEPKALHAARVGRPEAVVGEAAPAALFLYHIAFEGALM